MKVIYSEIFKSIQGEAYYVGHPTVWLRFAHCNLQCDGFGQEEPTKPETWELPYQEIDLNSIKRVEDLPVFNKGCDSSYTWSKRFAHLMKNEDHELVAKRLWDMMYIPESNTLRHLAFTGGEPLLKKNQLASFEILKYIFVKMEEKKIPFTDLYITYETNGTQKFISHEWFNLGWFVDDVNLCFSISPKLFSVSGEPFKKAYNSSALQSIRYMNSLENTKTYYKFVVSDTEDCFRELDSWLKLNDIKNKLIYLMPVGATKEQQQEKHIRKIADYCIEKNFIFCPRIHCDIWGNVIGT